MPDTLSLFGATFSELPPEAVYHPLNRYVADEEAEEAVHCANCRTAIEDGDAIDIEGAAHCPECVHTCEQCDTITADEDEIQSSATHGDYRYNSPVQSHSLLCSACRFTCADCSNEFANNIGNRENSAGDRICGSCSESYYSCEDCNCILHADDTFSPEDGGGTYCEQCMQSHSRGVLNSYSYKPTASFHRVEGQQSKRGLMYAGMELEVDHPLSRRDREDDIESAGMKDHSLLYCKEDGSLDNGFEIVSHPSTWEYWQAFKWDDIASSLKGNGYRSYDTSTCGMHVHISKDALSTLDIFKLLQFFRGNKAFITKVSRRRMEHLDRWAGIDESGRGDLCKKAKAKSNRGGERYTAINLENSQSVEFRIFRGTLDAKAIKRNLAFIVALCHFVKNTSVRDLYSKDFLAWLRGNGRAIIGRPDSRELIAWIAAHCPENEGD